MKDHSYFEPKSAVDEHFVEVTSSKLVTVVSHLERLGLSRSPFIICLPNVHPVSFKPCFKLSNMEALQCNNNVISDPLLSHYNVVDRH